MKVSHSAKQQAMSYSTALRWFHDGAIKGYQAPSGTIIVVEDEQPHQKQERVAIDAAAFAAKNLYNQATYHIRQASIHEGKYLPYAQLFHRLKHQECYEHPEKFRGKPPGK